jgi:hypothetical protein
LIILFKRIMTHCINIWLEAGMEDSMEIVVMRSGLEIALINIILFFISL